MFKKTFRVEAQDFRTLVSLSSGYGSKEFIKRLTDEIREDDRFSLHYASDVDDRVANLGLLVGYASHIRAGMIVRIKCHQATPKPSSAEVSQKPVVKVHASELKSLSELCGEKACIRAFPEDEAAEMSLVGREIQKRVADSISLDAVLRSLRDASIDKEELSEMLRELRGSMKKRTFFASIDIFPQDQQDIDSDVRHCSELIRILHGYFSRRNLLLEEARVVLS